MSGVAPFCPHLGTGITPNPIAFAPMLNLIPSGHMRIIHSDSEHLVALSDAEAAVLVEASALLVVASQSVAGAVLPPQMATVLGQLFDGLKVPDAVSSPPQDN